MAYTNRSELINCKVNDKVYVYNNGILNEFGNINENMIGVVESIDQNLNEDWCYTESLSYSVVLRMKNGEIIKIKDEVTRPFFRKYEFITFEDLKEIHDIKI